MGSSLPEMSVSFVALLKQRGGLSVGNLVGSNVLDTLLVPGIGAQGGDLSAVLSKGTASDGKGLIINSSRAILYADPENAAAGAAQAAGTALAQMRQLQPKVAPDRAVV